MQRSNELAVLSREHHVALELALRLQRATDVDAETVRRATLDFWHEKGRGHFRLASPSSRSGCSSGGRRCQCRPSQPRSLVGRFGYVGAASRICKPIIVRPASALPPKRRHLLAACLSICLSGTSPTCVWSLVIRRATLRRQRHRTRGAQSLRQRRMSGLPPRSAQARGLPN